MIQHTNHKPKLWFLYAISILLIAIPSIATAQDNPESDAGQEQTAEEDYVQSCAECHIDVVAHWQDSAHATAFDEAFTTAWSESNEAEICLDCHVTGFTPFSGEFSHQGVSCEACHGETPEDHPEQAVAIEPGLEVCASCHPSTYNEWLNSPHGEQQLACTSCHNPHPQEVRFGSSTQLCLNCHEETMQVGYAHTTHVDEDCTSCHWHHSQGDNAEHILTGSLLPSGHEANVETAACIDCHQNLDEDYLAEQSEADVENILTANLRLQELEAEVENVRAQGQNASAVRLVQGVIVGLAFGAAIAFIGIRLRPGRIKGDE